MSEIGEFPRRIPVVESGDFEPQDVDGQWLKVTECIKQDIKINPQTRSSLLRYCTIPVSQTLAGEAILAIASVDSRVKGLSTRYSDQLGTVLDLPPVPEDQITPDIANAKTLLTPDRIKQNVLNYTGDDGLPLYPEGSPRFNEFYQQDVAFAIEGGSFMEGITWDESNLVAQRYRFARDIKLLSLGAEIIEQPGEKVDFDDDGKIHLPSGIEIAANTDDVEARSDLINPLMWENRRQIKDRVYEISINGRKYILKEKKTARHTDTKERGHIDGATSEEEFATAQHFNTHANVDEGHLSLRWEKPIGSVTYPDGFQFTVFDFEEGLQVAELGSDFNDVLAKQIVDHQNSFQEEYETVLEDAKKYMDDIEETWREKELHGVVERAVTQRRLITKTRKHSLAAKAKDKAAHEFTFEQFARVKAHEMLERMNNLYRETICKNEYTNSDQDPFAFRFQTENGFQLEALGYDFEYFSKIDPDQARQFLKDRVSRKRKSDWDTFGGLSYTTGWKHGSDARVIRRIDKAAYKAILARAGRKPSESNDEN